jgi:hypothetical protein
MSDLNVRADAVDVEDIMRQIRARIREKRGTDYTEAEVTKLAGVKLEKFLDPRGLRSDLVEQFRRRVTEGPGDEFTEAMLYETPRPWLRRVRRLLNPILKLFFNPAAVSGALRKQGDVLQFEVIHNLVVEVTRLGIDVHNLKMRVESLSSRVDFDERRARSLEGVVQYRPPAPRPEQRRDARAAGRPDPRPQPRPDVRVEQKPEAATVSPAVRPAGAAPDAGAAGAPVSPAAVSPAAVAPGPAGPDAERRRRRRRRRRRPGQTMAVTQANGAGAPGSAPITAGAPESADEADDNGPDDGAAEE